MTRPLPDIKSTKTISYWGYPAETQAVEILWTLKAVGEKPEKDERFVKKGSKGSTRCADRI